MTQSRRKHRHRQSAWRRGISGAPTAHSSPNRNPSSRGTERLRLLRRDDQAQGLAPPGLGKDGIEQQRQIAIDILLYRHFPAEVPSLERPSVRDHHDMVSE